MLSLIDFIDMIDRDYCFSLSRFGDGEWNAIFGEKGGNCDGHRYIPEMGRELKKCLEVEEDNWFKGSCPGRSFAPNHDKILETNKDYKWHFKADVFTWANSDGNFHPFIKMLRTKNVLFVGPTRIRRIGSILDLSNSDFHSIPVRNCYMDIVSIVRQVKSRCYANKHDLVLFSAGMPSACMIYRLYPDLGQTTTLIDI